MRATVVVALAVPVLAALSGCGGGEPTALPEVSGLGMAPVGRTISGVPVERVVDGDTVRVLVDGTDVTVRMIGIDTPETVKPDSPVECFGPEASDFATEALTGATVTLELDASQGTTDRYDRTLAYVWIEQPDGSLALFNLAAVAGGYAVERQYGPTPYAWRAQFRSAEERARAAGAGLWGACDRS